MVKNIAASRHAKLKNEARSSKRNSMALLEQDAYTAFLRRLAFSKYRDIFALKGGMMMLVLTGNVTRPTKDVDLDGKKAMNGLELKNALLEIVNSDFSEVDGWVFHPETINIMKDRTDRMISGAKIRIDASLFKARVKVHIDVGFENAITPSLVDAKMPSLLKDDSPPQIKMYPVETSISEKFRAMVFYGRDNTRLKDYFDIVRFSEITNIDSKTLGEAIHNSFKRMDMEVPLSDNLEALSDNTVKELEPNWIGFLNKNSLEGEKFSITVEKLKNFVVPVVDYIHDGNYPGIWTPDDSKWDNLSLQPKI
jgi:hypothetical protein